MGWILLAAMAAAFIGFLIWYGNTAGYYDFGDVALATFFGGCVSATTAFVLVAAQVVIGNIALKHHDRYERVDLVAIKDGTQITGSFVLATGSVGADEKYRFYYRDHDGGVHLHDSAASTITLYEDSKEPYAIRYAGCTLEPNWAPCAEMSSGIIQEIHVPPGSVKTQIDLSLNK